MIDDLQEYTFRHLEVVAALPHHWVDHLHQCKIISKDR